MLLLQVGFRHAEVKGRQLLHNGQAVMMKGAPCGLILASPAAHALRLLLCRRRTGCSQRAGAAVLLFPWLLLLPPVFSLPPAPAKGAARLVWRVAGTPAAPARRSAAVQV